MEAEATGAPAPSDNKEQQKNEAASLLAQGQRHMLVKDFSEAVRCLEDACKLVDGVYGAASNECGEAYFAYGKALLEFAKLSNRVMQSDEVRGEEDGADSDSEKSGADEEGKTEEVDEKAEETDEKAEETDDKAEETDEVVANGHPAGAEHNNSAGDDDSEKEEEEDSDFKLAWEVLELAKLIFCRQQETGGAKMALRLADVYLALGEVGMEVGNYAQAITDMEQCLALQKKHLPLYDRKLAETYYYLGIACGLNCDYKSAAENYKNAVEVLELKITNLQTSDSTTSYEADPFYTVQGEIDEIKGIVPEINAAISDALESEKVKEDAVAAWRSGTSASSSNADGASTSQPTPSAQEAKPVSDISHLVRKKRKPEAEAETGASATKQVCRQDSDK